MSYRFVLIVMVVVFVFLFLPYLIAGSVEDLVFGGFLINPLDGNSYLAKMQIGLEGEWKFRLPFTADPGDGAFLFLFYIFLGHISRWLNIPILITFHAVRFACVVFLVWSLWKFIKRVFMGSSLWTRRRIFIWMCFGTGLGWLLFPFEVVTSDLWVAEAFPFLSMYSNPHFSLGMAILLWIIMFSEQKERFCWIKLMIGGLSISIIMPFGLVIAAIVIGGSAIWRWAREKVLKFDNLIACLILGGPFLLYQYIAASSDPVLSIWNSQNLTPSPPIWDFIISFSPAFLIAFLGLWRIYKNKELATCYSGLIAWFVLGFLLIYLPFGLQRRFMFAFSIPTVLLASYAIDEFVVKYRKKWIWSLMIGLSAMTSVLVVLMGLFGVQSRNSLLFLTTDEIRAFEWIRTNTPKESVILCSPEMGMFLPGYTARRVVYGHPFETANADLEKVYVNQFYSNTERWNISDLDHKDIDYVIIGPREFVIMGSEKLPKGCEVVFKSGDVSVCSGLNGDS